MHAALYARYSNDRQNDRSIADQLELCRRHAEQRGWEVVATFSDAAISGAAMANRPGLQMLLAGAEAGGFQVVLVEDTDRLARNREHDAHVYNRLTYAGVTIATPSTDKVTVIESALKGLMNELYLVQLGEKTSRGMRSNAEKGLATGSRLYGYRSAPGGEMAIVEAEAAVVRRILTDYAAGATGREIADVLNREGVSGPRGGPWNGSSINGSRSRANGILHTELYAGVKTWNRMTVRKDPATGRRCPRLKPESEWRRTAAEHLRIAPAELWAQVRARKAAEAKLRPQDLGNARKPGIFSGLLKCGNCGASYTAYTGGRLICAGFRERGPSVCGNRRTVSRAYVETRALDALKDRLLAPEAVAAYVRAYHAEWARLAAERGDRRRPLERRIGELHRIENRYCDDVEAGRSSQKGWERAIAAEQERARLEAELAAMDAFPAAPAVTLHPAAAERYAGLVGQLRANLAVMSADPRNPAHRAVIDTVRALVIKIEISPRSADRGAPVDLVLHGDLARFMEPAREQKGPECMGQVVAGGGIGPAPPSLPIRIKVA